jgi:hypothetical protein
MLRGLISKRNLLIIALSCFAVGLFLLLEGCTQTQTTSSATSAAQPTATPVSSGTSSSVASPQLAGVTISKPANGTYFAVGEQAVVTITLTDATGKTLNRATDFSQLRLMASGPIETADTVTAAKLLKASTDRTQTIHHYIDLTNNADVQVSNGVLTYKFAAVSDEKPGTYTVGIWAVLKADGLQQAMSVASFQIGNATVQTQIVSRENCGACHLGADSGKIYMHHIDPTTPGGASNWALDSQPVTDCKLCHNNNGYAAYTSPTDSTVKVADPIVKRVHGIHMGEGLTNAVDTNPQTGLFKDYSSVVFPKDVLNCTACHADDRWKTKPSQLACGACHDNTWFGDAANMPKGMVAHQGGPQATDAACAGCHPPDTGGIAAVSVVHNAGVNADYDKAVLTMSAPGNGKFYVAGEKPVVTIVFMDPNGQPIDHTKVVAANYSAANLFVYGPREQSKPVLTNAARIGNSFAAASVSNTKPATGSPTKGWTFADGDTFKIAVNKGAVQTLTAPTGLQTPDQVRDWLKTNLKDVTVASNNTTGFVTLTSNLKGDQSEIDIYNSPVTTKMSWKPLGLDLVRDGVTYGKTSGVTTEPYVIIGNVSTAGNDLRGTTDAGVKRNVANITYQLDDVAGLQPGTYMAFAYTNYATVNTKNGWPRANLGLTTFQIGTATPDPKIAENCTQCHGNTVQHLNEAHVHPGLFDPDYCKACHDYNRTGTGDSFPQTGGNSTSGFAGYGAKPISARVHGVHFGNYLDHPEYVYAGEPNKFNEVIFPQDVRNCTVCHDKNTSSTWKDQPSRLACTGCHDSDQANAHTLLMTKLNNPNDPYSSANIGTCVVCHGPTAAFAVTKVHNISTPFVPPYPRQPAR